MKKIVIIAGEKSGDAYGGFLSKKLKEKYPDLEIYSFGGDNLAKHSKQVVDLLSHSVTGLVEVLAHLGKILKVFNQIIKEIDRIKPDLVIPIDFPDFNLRLIKKLNKKYPIFYYVSPQLWAWRKGRINIIKKYVDKMVVLFKFEKEFYENNGVEALYFGHPLLEMIQKQDTPSKKIISFMPGSRKNEIKKHLPVMSESKDIIETNLPGYEFCVIKPKNITKDIYKELGPNLKVVDYSTEAIQNSEFIISASGTATVEIAILEIPYLIMYKVNSLTWLIIKKLVNLKFAGMVNILAGKKIIEELLQDKATPKNIAHSTLTTLKDEVRYRHIKHDLKDVKEILSPNNATEKLSSYIGNHLNL